MKISAHCCITNALSQNYPYVESIQSFAQFCDEVIVVDGGSTDDSIAHLHAEAKRLGFLHKLRVFFPPDAPIWDRDWIWHQLPLSINFAFEKCSGDIAIKFDVDYVWDDRTTDDFINSIYAWMDNRELHAFPPMCMVLHKFNFVIADKCFAKSQIPLVVNRRDYPDLRYGIAYKDDGDLMFVIEPKQVKYVGDYPLYMGDSILNKPNAIKNTSGAVYVYDFTFMDRNTVDGILQRAALARARFEEVEFNPAKREKIVRENALGKFRKFMRDRVIKYEFTDVAIIEQHPEVMREKLKTLNKDMFGYDGFGWFTDLKPNFICKYIK